MAVARARRVSPNSDPAIRLRRILAAYRSANLAWSDERYDDLTRRLTAALPDDSRESWMLVFTEQRSAWRSAYERSERVLCRLVGILD